MTRRSSPNVSAWVRLRIQRVALWLPSRGEKLTGGAVHKRLMEEKEQGWLSEHPVPSVRTIQVILQRARQEYAQRPTERTLREEP